MKTTIDLPETLVRRLKLRAIHDRRKLKDLAAELLQNGLAAPTTAKSAPKPAIIKNKRTRLPVIQCPQRPTPNQHLTPDDIAQILNDQDAQWATGKPAR